MNAPFHRQILRHHILFGPGDQHDPFWNKVMDDVVKFQNNDNDRSIESNDHPEYILTWGNYFRTFSQEQHEVVPALSPAGSDHLSEVPEPKSALHTAISLDTAVLRRVTEAFGADAVIFTVIHGETDGQQDYHGRERIRNLIKQLSLSMWRFNYVGVDQPANVAAGRLSIPSYLRIEKSESGILEWLNMEKKVCHAALLALKNKWNLPADLYREYGQNGLN